MRYGLPFRGKKRDQSGSLAKSIGFGDKSRKNAGVWFVDEKLSGGGAVMDHTVHVVDIVRWLLELRLSRYRLSMEDHLRYSR